MLVIVQVLLGAVSGYVLFESWIRRSYLWGAIGAAALIAPAVLATRDGSAVPFFQIVAALVVFGLGTIRPALVGKAREEPREYASDTATKSSQ